MYAIQVKNKGKHLQWGSIPAPTPPQGYASVKVQAAGVNRADILQRKGYYPPPKGASEILGLEIAGSITKINGKRQGWKQGDRVMALVPGGAYASEAIVPVDMLLPVPPQLDYTEAAAIPEAIYTAYLNLFEVRKLKPSETLLVHAGAGGIGSTVIQLAKAHKATVIATAGTHEKVKLCRQLGAEQAINYHHENLREAIQQAAENGIDVIFDPVGGPRYTKLNVDLLNKYGRWILIGLLGGLKGDIHLGKVLQKNLRLLGSTLRYRPENEKTILTKSIRKNVCPLYESGAIRPVVDKVFNIQNVEQAHQYMIDNKVKGKIVLEVNDR